MSARTMGRRRKRELCCLVLAIVLPAAVSGNSFTGRLLRRRRAQEDVVVNLTVTEPPTEAPLVEEVIPYEHVEDIEEEHGAGMTVVEDYVDEEEWLVDTSNTSLLENPLEEVPPLLTEMDYDLDMDEEEEEEDEEVYPADADFAAEGQFDSDYDEGGDGEDVGEDSEAEVAPTDAGFAAEGQFESEYYEDSQDSVAPAEADFGEEGQFDSEYQGGDEEEFGEDEEVEVTPADAGFSAEGQFDSEYEGGDEEEEDTEGDFVVEPYSVHESFETEADEHTEDETYSLPVTESSQYQVLNPPWLAQDEPTVEETSDSATTYQVISPPWITSAEDTAEDSEASAPVSTAQGLSLGFAQQSYTAPSSAPTLAPTEDKSDSTLGWTTEGAAPKGGQVVYPFWNPPAEEDKEESIDEDEEVMQLQVLKPVWWTDKNESEGGFFEGDTDKWEVAGADEAPSSNSSSEETPLTNSTSDEPLYLEQAMEMGGANESVANDTTSTNVSEGSQPEYTDITIHYLPQRPPPGKGKGYVWNDYPRGPHPSKGSPKMPKGSKGCDMPSKKGGKKKKCSESQKTLSKSKIQKEHYFPYPTFPTTAPTTGNTAPSTAMPTLVLGENPTLTPGTTAAPVPAPGTTPPTTAPATTPTIPNEPDTGNPDTFAPTAAIGPAPTVDPFATRPPTLPIPEESGETPSLSPSSSPSDIVLGTATPTAEVVQAEINEMWVVSDPITVEASGATDLQEYKQEFFDVTMKAMQQYLSAYLGEVLLQFNLKLTFLESDTEVTPVGITSGNALVKSYFIISVEYKIGSESMDVLIEFTNNWADKLVEDFFRGTAKVRLIADLEAEEMFLSGFRVIKISVNDGGGDPPNDQGEDEGDFGNIPGDADSGGNDPVDESTKSPTRTPTDAPSTTPEQLSDVEDTPTPTTTSTSNTALYAGIVSAGVVFIALIAVVYSSRRRKRLWFNDAVDSVADSLYSDGLGPPDGKVLPVLTPRGVSMATTHTTRTSLSSGSTPTRSRVKPAAIQLRGQNGKSHGSVSTLGSLNMPLRPVLERRDNEDNESTDTEEKHDDDLMRMEDGPDLLATNTLTSLDNSYSFDRMAETYPEFELYSGVPSTWSVDGLTLEDDEEAERIEQARHRRRWQDEYTDLELRGLPEHESSEGSRRARGSAYSASSGYSGSSHGSAGYRRRVD